MKKAWIILAAIVLLLACIGVSYQSGRNAGFEMGSEWALIQADIVAEEAGVFMPVYLKDGKFRVVHKQQRGIYKRAREMADAKEHLQSANAQHEINGPDAKDSI